MSIIKCGSCERPVDTDYEECFMGHTKMNQSTYLLYDVDYVICQTCYDQPAYMRMEQDNEHTNSNTYK